MSDRRQSTSTVTMRRVLDEPGVGSIADVEPIPFNHGRLWHLPYASSTIQNDILAGHVARCVRAEELDGGTVFVNIGHASHRDQPRQPFDEGRVLVVEDPAGRDRV